MSALGHQRDITLALRTGRRAPHARSINSPGAAGSISPRHAKTIGHETVSIRSRTTRAMVARSALGVLPCAEVRNTRKFS